MASQVFADIVFPTAVRRYFTYRVPGDMKDRIRPGMRVWVPFQKRRSIGMVVKVHGDNPDFSTKPVERLLDEKPILSESLLELTEWIHRFYYCGWGECVQAALPMGLNFYAEKYLRVAEKPASGEMDPALHRIVAAVAERGEYLLSEAEKRWSDDEDRQALDELVSRGILEVWEKPETKVSPRTEKHWYWAEGVDRDGVTARLEEFSDRERDYKWVKALALLKEIGLPARHEELKKEELLDNYSLNRIAEEGLIVSREVEAVGFDLDLEYDPAHLKKLNEEQQQALNAIREPLDRSRFNSFLLYGITGSGKTEVYIHALKHALERDMGGLVLVPEISLTPQIIKRFYRIFGDTIAVVHSRLTSRERYDAWRALQQGEKKIAIGARSAVFAPVENLGIIVVDEEHDASYKQEDPAPRYHARDVALMRAQQSDAVVVMGSATPSMETLQGVRTGRNDLLSLSDRPLDATLPEVRVLNLKEYRYAKQGPLAVPLYEALSSALERDEQGILLLNRRGYASFLQCGECGEIPECPNCSVSLTYHKVRDQLRCHYCGYSSKAASRCRECGREALEPVGTGTQQLEEEISDLFPGAGILRLDFDTTSGRNAHRDILERFARKEADLLVGTQSVGKGLDFPDVTVVGVVNADTELAFPSFRSAERLYQLLSQVAGRSGRSSKEGKVYFQTWQPDHPAIRAAKNHDYRSFAKQELAYRKSLRYPPFSRIIRFVFKGKNEDRVRRVAEVFTSLLIDLLDADSVLGPSPSSIARMQRFFRWESMVKIEPSRGARAVERMLDRAFERFGKKRPKGTSSVRINVNVDALE